ncbi:MAG: helix-turn-helix transcriptional regulator [Clostridia bacterium]|nr:helix-turn-helix transcriptional regulator [Clostridia bacterium]
MTLEERFGKCPYATAQTLISGKWAVLILLYLEDGPIRFNDLLRKMPKMTHATLSVQLKTLEQYGLIRRVQYEAIPPRVEYSLTEIGQKFRPVVAAMETWGNEYIAQMQGETNA